MPVVFELRITLRRVSPLVWRRFLTLDNFTLARLHIDLQTIMGWDDYHRHGYCLKRGRTIVPIDDRHECRIQLRDVFRRPGDCIGYDYDHGAGWFHDLVLQRVRCRLVGERRTVVIAGHGACPPENIRGPAGYRAYIETRRLMAIESGRPFDPGTFDLERANRMLRGR